ncbi:S-adenosylmethionine carrier 1, chloroplastic/mitochondrial [Gracilariopsis chorda]|uniref:S-adenosylmethionine carrier 1, chloroplastic/mitochondrial n=1 Tax=Gracilariopsis chorda TaxID=448386 RepID=A0A2V3IRR0_9FLOR|nr:S-adenosylmethionine carrier 1, chloroplastic/mitochondrial [Gracilariopsis chorda]|eukprot:PXF44789.1 S-adenosylmethionine carrier 1, chloroplastic/mitochondrial [Gracilariopsis chorda]
MRRTLPAIRNVPFKAAEFGIFHVLSSLSSRIKSHVEPFDTLLFGIATGACVGAALAPLDFVVTRCMAEPTRYRGVLNTITKVVREEGVRAIFNGFGHKVVREAASSALFFTVFDNLQPESHSTPH